MKHCFIKLAAALFVVMNVATVAAQDNVVKIPADKSVVKGRLPNGLTYYIKHNEEPKGLACFYIAQKVGSIQEEANQRGLAHFLEHMCFNGTKHFPGTSLRSYLEKIGVKFGADLNAYTAVDETVYNIDNVPVNTPGTIDSCLWILHDWSNDLTLDPVEIDNERGVITEEWRSRNNAVQRISTQMMPVIMEGSKYADCMPIGSMEIVNSFAPQVLRDYYEKWYRPDLQGIVVVGDVNVKEIEKKIKKIFSDIPAAPTDAAERVYYPVPDNKEPIVFIGTDKEYPSTGLTVYFKHDATPRDMNDTEQHFIDNILDSQIDYLFHMRTAEITQTENAPFDWCTIKNRGYFLSNTKEALTMSIDTKKHKGAFERGCRAAFDELNRLRRYGFTKEEWERSKADLKSSVESMYKRKDKRYSQQLANEYVRNFLDNESMPDIEYLYKLYNRTLDRITVDDLNARLRSFFNDNGENMVFVYAGIENDTIQTPAKEDILRWYAEQGTKELTPYKDVMAGLTLLPQEPMPGKILNRVVDKATGMVTLTLSNGATVVIHKTDFEKDKVFMSALSRGGMSLFPEEMYKYGSLLNTSLGVMGLGNLTWSQLQKYNAGVNASIQVGFGDNIESIQGSSTTGDAGKMLEMVHAAFLYPNNDPQAFKSLIGKLSHNADSGRDKPMYAYGQALSFAQYGQNGYTADVTSQEYKDIDYNQLLELYKQRFADAGDFNFYFLGDVDEKALTPYIEKYLASLPSLNRKEDCKPIKVRRKGIYETYFEHKQETPTANISLIYTADTDYNLKNYLLSSILGQVMNIVYTKTIREDAGAAYSVGCGGEAHQYPTSAAELRVRFTTNPEKMDLAVGLVKEGLENMVANGPDAENLAKVKEYLRKTLESNRTVNQYWMYIHNQEWFTGVNLDKGYEDVLAGITAKDVQDFAADMLRQNNRIQVVMNSPKDNEETK
ncbi:MAG: insulinase family protein [Bacteroides sp.]|nr:insulinase family protein [Bacteroides sp.]MCM1391012.1 insulinase family protein [Bacteroides sp.]